MLILLTFEAIHDLNCSSGSGHHIEEEEKGLSHSSAEWVRASGN